jgi:Raf kinase inhibitor-like YbhB/YbcL family protein
MSFPNPNVVSKRPQVSIDARRVLTPADQPSGGTQMRKLACLLMLSLVFVLQCNEGEESQEKGKGEKQMEITLTSDAFAEGGMIPEIYTCDGPDISPPLKWSGVPEGTKSLALICDDPDAPSKTWVHWVLYNIPPDMTALNANLPKIESLDNGAKHGVTDFGRFGYGGPCPPGGTHRYFFKIYALDTVFDHLSGRVSKSQLESEIEGHTLASGQLIGRYARK